MNRDRLLYFVDLAQTLNYTETAERLYTTQGNVSKQIIALEKELSTKLFLREHRQIKLTDAGQTLLPEAKKILQAYENFDDTVSAYRQSQSETLVLHGLPTMASYAIMDIIGHFYEKHTQYELLIEEEESEDLEKSLRTQHAQVIFNRYFKDELPQEDYLVIDNDELVVVLPAKHPLASKDTIQLSDLKNDVFFQIGNTSKLYNKVIDACLASGFTPNIKYQGKRINYILEFIAKNMGVSLMMKKSLLPYHNHDIVVKPLNKSLECQLCLVKSKGNTSKAVSLFWEFVKNELNASIQ